MAYILLFSYVFAAYMLIKITPLFLPEEFFFIENAGELPVEEEFCIIGITAQYAPFPYRILLLFLMTSWCVI